MCVFVCLNTELWRLLKFAESQRLILQLKLYEYKSLKLKIYNWNKQRADRER